MSIGHTVTFAHAHTLSYTQTLTLTHTQYSHIHTHVGTLIHTQTHTLMRAHSYSHTRTHVHTHSHTLNTVTFTHSLISFIDTTSPVLASLLVTHWGIRSDQVPFSKQRMVGLPSKTDPDGQSKQARVSHL